MISGAWIILAEGWKREWMGSICLVWAKLRSILYSLFKCCLQSQVKGLPFQFLFKIANIELSIYLVFFPLFCWFKNTTGNLSWFEYLLIFLNLLIIGAWILFSFILNNLSFIELFGNLSIVQKRNLITVQIYWQAKICLFLMEDNFVLKEILVRNASFGMLETVIVLLYFFWSFFLPLRLCLSKLFTAL